MFSWLIRREYDKDNIEKNSNYRIEGVEGQRFTRNVREEILNFIYFMYVFYLGLNYVSSNTHDFSSHVLEGLYNLLVP